MSEEDSKRYQLEIANLKNDIERIRVERSELELENHELKTAKLDIDRMVELL